MRILATLLCVGLAACAHVDVARETAVKLQFPDGSCSGTIIGPHVILSATHCFTVDPRIAIWRQPARILARMDDGNDHTIIRVDRTFPVWAVIGHMPKMGSEVHMIGNPGDLPEVYRHGYIAGMAYIDGKLCDVYDMRIWFGDSGSGIFDADGDLIGVVSFIYTLDSQGSQLTMAGSFPLMFTPAQWAEAER